VSVLTTGLLAGACTSAGEGAPSPTRSTSTPTISTPASPTPARSGSLAGAKVALERVAVLEQPVALAVRAGDPALYIVEKTGRVVALDDGGDPRVVLDLSHWVSLGSEQGLLGLAFSPDGDFLYVDLTDLDGNTRVIEFRMEGGAVDVRSGRDVLDVPQPFSNHNGGNLAFGPDGYLYIAFGDGGSAGDPQGNGQSLATLLGKILRISPRPADGEYAIPPDNPFVGSGGARPEIWAYGLRNPWRFSFDRATGDLWIGDVGQNSWEEIDVQPAGSPGGLDYGWNLLEGTHPFAGQVPGDLQTVPPVYEYPHDGTTCAVTGGYVYRGTDIPTLVGAYVFADFCRGALEAFVLHDGVATGHRDLGPTVDGPASFGEDENGELYVLSLSGPVYRLVQG
jgi:glucose/arabinose dehydrogenase